MYTCKYVRIRTTPKLPRFRDDNSILTDLVPEFLVVAWVRYVSQMAGHPLLTSNAAIKVLVYFSVNEDHFLKGYHNRIYAFSSGSIFLSVSEKLEQWMHQVQYYDSDGEDDDSRPFVEGEDDDEDDVTPVGPPPSSAENMLRKVITIVYVYICAYTKRTYTCEYVCIRDNISLSTIYYIYMYTCIYARIRNARIRVNMCVYV